jgi:hypothetical protein
MKKLLVVLLALLAVGFVFAEGTPASLTVGGWGRMWVSPLSYNGTDLDVTSGPAWGGNGGRVGVSFTGNSDNIGFTWNPGVTGNSMTPVCDNAAIWVKLNPMFKITVGEYEGDTLRGKIGGDASSIFTVGPSNDNIFQRFYPKTGLLLGITPIDAVYIGAAIDSAGTDNAVPGNDPYNTIQVAGGYTIANVGLARVQYIAKQQFIQAAFAYTGTAGLTIDVGGKYSIDSTVAQSANKVALGFKYAADAFSVVGQDYFTFDGQDYLWVNAGYNLSAALTGGLEVTYATAGGSMIEFMPYAKLPYSNGYLKIGFYGKLDQASSFTCQLPIVLEYGF